MSDTQLYLLATFLQVYGYLKVWTELKDFKASILERLSKLEVIHKNEITE